MLALVRVEGTEECYLHYIPEDMNPIEYLVNPSEPLLTIKVAPLPWWAKMLRCKPPTITASCKVVEYRVR